MVRWYFGLKGLKTRGSADFQLNVRSGVIGGYAEAF